MMFMLQPSKHTDLNQTVIAVAAVILRHMRKTRIEEYSALSALVRQRSLADDLLFVPALNLLFVLGLIDYRPKADVFEYTGPR